jgi:hypothetical protein
VVTTSFHSCGIALSAPNEEVGVTPPLPAPQTTVPEVPSEPSPSPANPAVGGASAPAKRVPVAVIAVVVAVIAAGAGAAITLVAKGSGHGSHGVGAALTNAAPPGTSAPSGTVATPNRAIDLSAKQMARTAEITAETIATDNNGSYASTTPETLKADEPGIVVCPGSSGQACISAAKGTEATYTVTAMAEPSGGEFTIEHNASGDILRTCVARSAEDTGCQNGTW